MPIYHWLLLKKILSSSFFKFTQAFIMYIIKNITSKKCDVLLCILNRYFYSRHNMEHVFDVSYNNI